MSRIEKALCLAEETKALKIGVGVLNEVSTLFKQQFGDKEAIIVTDSIIVNLVGNLVCEILDKAGIRQRKMFIFEEDDLYAEYTFVEKLVENFKLHKAIPIAIGSGAINDLVKLASKETNRQYMCVATAASMDGYTAFGASVTANGAKQTFNCPAPQVCVADINIISKAPNYMTASGYADLFAKVTAGADWILADALQVEMIDKKSWDIVQEGLQESLVDTKGVAEGETQAIEGLIEGLMLGGFAMQSHKTSRPASGAEHQFSHLWNMEHHTNNGEHISHGFQVAIGTLSITALYEVMLKTDIKALDIDACCNAWPTAEELAEESREVFKGTDFPEIGYQETKAKYVTKEELQKQLQLLKDNWTTIKTKLYAQLVPFEEVKARLKEVGAPTEPEDIGVGRNYLRQTFIRAQYIRRRFTVLDLAVRTNLLNIWLDELFGDGGLLSKK